MLTILATLTAAQVLPPAQPVEPDEPTRAESPLLPAQPEPSKVGLATTPNRSVYQLHPAIDLPVIGVGAAIGAIRLFGTEELVARKCPCDPATLNSLDRSVVQYNNRSLQVVADISMAVIIAIPVVLDALDLGFSKPFLEDLVVFLETLLVNTGLQAGTALIVQRPRPLAYAGDPQLIDRGEGYVSFYAGHVATTFAVMSVVSQTLRLRYGMKVWPWVATAALGSLMAVMRMGSGDHFPTDVIAGLVAGLAIGIAVPWLHARAPESQVRIVPAQGGLGLAGKF